MWGRAVPTPDFCGDEPSPPQSPGRSPPVRGSWMELAHHPPPANLAAPEDGRTPAVAPPGGSAPARRLAGAPPARRRNPTRKAKPTPTNKVTNLNQDLTAGKSPRSKVQRRGRSRLSTKSEREQTLRRVEPQPASRAQGGDRWMANPKGRGTRRWMDVGTSRPHPDFVGSLARTLSSRLCGSGAYAILGRRAGDEAVDGCGDEPSPPRFCRQPCEDAEQPVVWFWSLCYLGL